MKKLLLTGLVALTSSISAHAVDPGSKAPDFKLTNLAGEAVSLADLKGKVVVLEWINYGCPFVEKHYASGNMQKLQQQAIDKGAVWITINSSAEGKQGYHPAAEMAKLAEKNRHAGSHFTIDAAGTVGRAYDAKVTPHLFVIDASGTVAYNGAIDAIASVDQADVAKAEPLFKNALEAVLAGKPVKDAKNKPYGCGVKYAK